MTLEAEAQRIARLLKKRKIRLVLAESCTGGFASATFTAIPGVSQLFSGSFVTYRDSAKSGWIGVTHRTLKKHGAVSPETALAMAKGALRKTPDAQIAASITGHLGPGAPQHQDGLFYVAVLTRDRFIVQEFRLQKSARFSRVSASQKQLIQLRLERRQLASHCLFLMVRSLLEASKT